MQDGSVRLSKQCTHILVDAGDNSPLVVAAWDEIAVAAWSELVGVDPSSVGIIMLLLLILVGRIIITVVSSSSDYAGHCEHVA